ncbi:DNA or RNA helicase of superfamily II [[Clostridium] ultunense Esp]|nr:DNA or RNA helicase of superfamily II [[Clostridium] ultunense Esp]
MGETHEMMIRKAKRGVRMKELIYYVKRGEAYHPIYEYKIPENMLADEAYARQLCTYFIKDGIQYELYANELHDEEEVIVLLEQGVPVSYPDEENYRDKGLFVEFRKPMNELLFTRIARVEVTSHYEVIRYLLKDLLKIPGTGLMERTSSEIDEDRGCYVIYVKEVKEED